MKAKSYTSPCLALKNISKQFPGVKALDNVDFTLISGEVHAVCGENGAGKSTLMNILSGNILPDTGKLEIDKKEVIFSSPQAAIASGIAIVYQHLSLVDSMSVAENIYANQQPHGLFGLIDFKLLYKNTSQLLKQLSIDINPRTLVSRLSPAQKQMIEIAKALSKNPKILIFDEPTASLTERETTILFDIIGELKLKKVAMVYISHRLPEIFRIADRISVLKDGKKQGTFDKTGLSHNELIKLMIGREIKQIRKQSSASSKVLLETRQISGAGFKNISFKLFAGEILGISGLVGAGRTEIAKALFGAKEKSGSVFVAQKEVSIKHTADAIEQRIAYVPEERKELGLFLEMSVADNMSSSQSGILGSSWLFDGGEAVQTAQKYKEILRIATPGVRQKVINLSGGNQQKVVLAKWLLTNPEILIVDEPTHGIDVGAKFEIYEILVALAKEGKGIILISSDMPELLGLCDRILVLRQGEITGELLAEEATEEKIMALAT